jgi:hypothetical protein
MKEWCDAEVFTDEAGGGAVFVGKNCCCAAAAVERTEELFGAGQEGDTIVHVFLPVLAKAHAGFGNEGFVVRADEATYSFLQTASDGAVDLFKGRLRQTQRAHGVAMRTMDRGKVIDECAIEIKEHSAKFRYGHVAVGSVWHVVKEQQVLKPVNVEAGKARFCGTSLWVGSGCLAGSGWSSTKSDLVNF